MKTKNFKKKLVLNKKTIVHLGNDHMGRAKGGEFTDDTCGSCYDPTYCWGCPTLICPDRSEGAGDCLTETANYTGFCCTGTMNELTCNCA